MSEWPPGLLPVHAFVLAGGKSSRMGQDKALLRFGGAPLVQIAIDALRSFCEAVSISGNRDDLNWLAPVVHEARTGAGPVAGLEAGLGATSCQWTLFLPVDVPLAPTPLLRRWAEAVLQREADGVRLSSLRVGGARQPAFCMLHAGCAVPLGRAVQDGERKLSAVFDRIAGELGAAAMWIPDAETLVDQEAPPNMDLGWLFSNVNTPEDLAVLHRGQQKSPAAE